MTDVQAQPSMLERLKSAAQAMPNRPVLQVGGHTLTYRQLEHHAQRTAQALAHSGLTSGKTLALVLPNDASLVIYTFAAYACGAAIVLFHPDIDADKLADQLKACDARFVVICDKPLLLAIAVQVLTARHVDCVIVASNAAHLPIWRAWPQRLMARLRGGRPQAGTVPGLVYERDALREARQVTSRAAREPKTSPKSEDQHAPAPTGADVAIRLVTARPDGIQIASLTHALIADAVDQLAGSLPSLVPGQERILVLVPLHALVAMTATLNLAVTKASQLICIPSVTPKALRTVLKRTRPTVIVANTPHLATMAAQPASGAAQFTNLKLIVNLDWDKPTSLINDLASLSPAPVFSCYCVDSVGALIAIGPASQSREPNAVGRALPRTQMVVRDIGDLKRIVGPGERGELCVGGPQVVAAPGLLRVHKGDSDHLVSDDSAGAFVAGLLRTGDLGAIDIEGQVFVVDRIEDMIVAAGYLIYPRRIEAALREHPGVGDVCVIGINDTRRGQAPKAFVVLNRGIAVTDRDLRLHLASRITKIEMPSDIDFCKFLPRLPSGTVCKATLRAQARSQDR